MMRMMFVCGTGVFMRSGLISGERGTRCVQTAAAFVCPQLELSACFERSRYYHDEGESKCVSI